MREEISTIARAWALSPARAVQLGSESPPNGTLLLRTGDPWDSLIGFATHHSGELSPGLLFKNPIPLWQYAHSMHDGCVSVDEWPLLRRRILIHNPGLTGVLELLDETVVDHAAFRSPPSS